MNPDDWVPCCPCGVTFRSKQDYDHHYWNTHVPRGLPEIAEELAEALRQQLQNPFGVGQYKVTEAALERWEAAHNELRLHPSTLRQSDGTGA